MATDNTSDISENDIIVAFELKNNSNPLAIYLEYQSKFLFGPNRPSVCSRTAWWFHLIGVQMHENWSELERLTVELNYPCLALNFQCRIKRLLKSLKPNCICHTVWNILYGPYSSNYTNFKLIWSQVHPPFSSVYCHISVDSRLRYGSETCLETILF